MHFYPDIWRSLTGIAIFLLGINFVEESLRHLSRRPFKLFLKKQTSNKLKAITGGAVATGMLQSSSLVNLMVLGFVGAGVIKMQNALAIILGANLGTTFNSWLIATMGFSFNPEDFALPMAGISGIMMMLVNKSGRWYQWSRIVFGLAFLFIGLNFIRYGIEGLVQHVNLNSLKDQPGIIFLITGFIITSLVQSSAAAVAIALSALQANAISLVSGMAFVLGAEVGTTIKLVLASVNGISAKKRVAAGNFLFNCISTIIVLIFIYPISYFITDIVGIKDHLIALVFFQSFVNLAGIVLFYPFLEIFGRFLEKRFEGKDDEGFFIRKVPAGDEEMVLDTLEQETRNLIFHVLNFTAHAFEIEFKMPADLPHRSFERKSLKDKYEYIKKLHGDIHGFFIQLQVSQFASHDRERLERLVSCNRNSMYAAKNVRDALNDINQLRNSSNDTKFDFYRENERKMTSFCEKARRLMEGMGIEKNFDEIVLLYKNIQHEYTATLQELYKEGIAKNLSHLEISTLINFNREMYTAYKSFVFALKDFLLDVKQTKYFDDLPGFIR